MQDILKKLEIVIRELFANDSSGHDLHHLKRVMNMALKIQEIEGGDRVVIAVSALLHDVHRIIENETGEFCSPKDSLPQIIEILKNVELTKNQTSKILHCIEFHEEYDFSEHGKTVHDIETLIVQDADNLDAIGAIGVGRTFAYSGAHGIPMWIPEVPFNTGAYEEAESKRDPSTLHHFHSKLLKLKVNMNTKTSLKIAQKRHDVIVDFVEEFKAEWDGER